MNWFEKLQAAFNAIKLGEQLTHSDTWKSRQIAANAIGALFLIGIQLVPLEIPKNDLDAIAYAIAVVGGLLNAYLAAATSKRVGLRPAIDDGDDEEHLGR